MLRPLLLFAVAGGVLYAAQATWHPAPSTVATTPVTIELAPAELDSLRANFVQRAGRDPSDTEWAGLLREAADQAILIHEALRLKVHRLDPVVRERLVKNMRFAYPDDPRDDDALFAEALALNMAASDSVVRRRLVQIMEHAMRTPGRALPIKPAELEDYYAAHPKAFMLSERIELEHRYSSQGPQFLDHAAEAFIHGARFAPLSRAELAKRMGEEFADAAFRLPANQWSKPIRSAFGWHSVRVIQRQPSQRAALDAVSAQIRSQLRKRNEATALSEGLQVLRQRYQVQAGEQEVAA